MNMPTVDYCRGCGEFLPPPPGYLPDLPPVQQPESGLSVPAILLIASIVLLVAMAAIFLLLFVL